MKVLKCLIFLLIVNYNYSQNLVLNAAIKVNDSTVISDNVIATKHGLKSINHNKLYEYSKIKEVTIKRENEKMTFYMLETKNNLDLDEKSLAGIGYKVFENSKIELFNVLFGQKNKRILYMDKASINFQPNKEVFIRKKNHKYVYNIAFIDGRGWDRIDMRLRKFFYDCPELFKEKKKRKIRSKETIKIADLYQEICN